MQKILLDTDIGGDIDDAICLAYLLCEPECDLIGITTVCGEPEKRAAVADAVCCAAGREIPIAAGMDETLQPRPVYPTPEGAGALARWPHRNFRKGDAPEFLYRKITENPGEAILVAIGNMTNVASLLLRHPDAAGMLRGIYQMNGYFGEKPLPDPSWNWNCWADPKASETVFRQGGFQRVLPLEVTETLTLPAIEADKLLDGRVPLLRAVRDFGGAWLASSGKLTFHDPLAAVAVFHPEICRFRRGFVSVETEDEGRMAETRFSPSEKGNVEIAREADRAAFFRILTETLRGAN